jgi:hypothetical protein
VAVKADDGVYRAHTATSSVGKLAVSINRVAAEGVEKIAQNRHTKDEKEGKNSILHRRRLRARRAETVQRELQ